MSVSKTEAVEVNIILVREPNGGHTNFIRRFRRHSEERVTVRNFILARIYFDCLEPLCVRQGIVKDIGIRNEPGVAMTEILLGFTAQTTIGCPAVTQLTLFPSGYPNWTTPSWEQRKLGELYSLVSEKND